jgi:hypothetical protein
MQYADDTMLITSINENTMEMLYLILNGFSVVSGLHINFIKSCIVPFNLTAQAVYVILNIFQCQQSFLPIIYLGLPLTRRKPSREDYIKLLEKLEKRLAGWRGKLISRGGQLQLLNDGEESLSHEGVNCNC